MTYSFNQFKEKITEINNWLVKEYAGIRTGRATPLLLDSILVESYGNKVPLKHISAINVEDAKTLKITPWDRTQMGAIETAISQANLGLSTAPDANGVRVIFPDLTAERRKMLAKLTGEKFEEAKISLRKERERVLKDLDDKEKGGEISEDDKFRSKEELQKLVDQAVANFENLAKAKEIEIAQ